MRSLNRAELLNVTTFRKRRIKSSPVAGFLTLRSFFSLTVNFPKPEIKRSSPDASVLFIMSIIRSTYSDDCFCDQPFSAATLSMMLALVRVTGGLLPIVLHVALSACIVKENSIMDERIVGLIFIFCVTLLMFRFDVGLPDVTDKYRRIFQVIGISDIQSILRVCCII